MKNIRYVLICLLIFFVTFISGCVSGYLVKVDAISDRAVKLNPVYRILPGNKGVGARDLQFKEFAGMLVKTLAMQGYTLAADSQKAEIEIYLSYGVGEPEKQTYSYTEPVWGQTGVEIYSQTNQYDNPDSNMTTQQTATYIEPQYGVTGYTSRTGEYLAYEKYVIIDAFDIKNGKPGKKLAEIWKTSVSSTGNSKDLRKMFPYYLAAAAKYIGENTGEELSLVIAEDSKEIKAIKGN